MGAVPCPSVAEWVESIMVEMSASSSNMIESHIAFRERSQMEKNPNCMKPTNRQK